MRDISCSLAFWGKACFDMNKQALRHLFTPLCMAALTNDASEWAVSMRGRASMLHAGFAQWYAQCPEA